MIQLSSLSLYRGSRCLLENINLIVYPHYRVGLTGQNGVGKSSLFALLRGELAPEKGDCSVPRAAVIAHVAQETPAQSCSALDYVLDGDAQLREIQKKIADAESIDDGEAMANAYVELDSIDGYTAESRAATLLNGLGFSTHELSKPVSAFSGGWRVRLNLAQALMCRSDILLLDEPTNHLDLDSVVWLEEWLVRYPGTLIMISHDRTFLDNVIQHVIHIENKTAKMYSGNYSQFEKIRSEELALQQKLYEKQQIQRAHLQSFVDRFKAKATKAKQAQSRVKALERMIEIAPAHVDSPFSFSFKAPDRLPFQLLTISNANIGYASQVILNEVNFRLNPGDRIGLLGINGAGKSTLIKVLAGINKPLSGEYQIADKLNVGYFAQHQLEQLDPLASPVTHIQRLSRSTSESSIRAFIGGFGFGNDKLDASVGQFSGGEKSRLVLAMLVWQKPQVLLLDEPTNHLDLEMRYALNTALQAFEGALVLVSHDRYLLQSVCDDFYRVHDGRVELYPDGIEGFQTWLQSYKRDQSALSREKPSEISTVDADKKEQRQKSAVVRERQQPIRNEIIKLEKQLKELTQALKSVDELLANPNLYQQTDAASQLADCTKRKMDILAKIEIMEIRWMECQAQLEDTDST